MTVQKKIHINIEEHEYEVLKKLNSLVQDEGYLPEELAVIIEHMVKGFNCFDLEFSYFNKNGGKWR